MSSKIFYVDIDLNNNSLNNTVLGPSDSLSTAPREGAIGYEDGVLKFRDAATTHIIASQQYVYEAGTSGNSSFSNGLTKTDNVIKLGGTLSETTTLTADSNEFIITGNNATLSINNNNGFSITKPSGAGILVGASNQTFITGAEISLQGDNTTAQLTNNNINISTVATNGVININSDQANGIVNVSGTTLTNTSENYSLVINDSSSTEIARIESVLEYNEFQAFNDFSSKVVWNQYNDQIYIITDATTYGETPVASVISLNETLPHTVSNSFPAGTGFSDSVLDIMVSGSHIYIVTVGFSNYNGTTITDCGVFRTDHNGVFDANWIVSVSVPAGARVFERPSDGQILIVTASGGLYLIDVTDGSIDNTFDAGSGLNINTPNFNIAFQSNGKIIAIGDFSDYNGDAISGFIVRINTDGTLDNTFASGSGFNDLPVAIAVLPDDSMMIVGTFTMDDYDGDNIAGLAKLNSDGTIDTTFITNFASSGYLGAFAGSDVKYNSSNSAIYISGFLIASPSTSVNVIKLNTDGTNVVGWNNVIINDGTNVTSAITATSNGLYIVGADVGTVNTTDVFGIAKVDLTTGLLTFSTIFNSTALFKYDADYSTTFGPRSLVDKAYVDNSGATVSNGLTKVGNDIRLGGSLIANVETNVDLIWTDETTLPSFAIRGGEFGMLDLFKINQNESKLSHGGSYISSSHKYTMNQNFGNNNPNAALDDSSDAKLVRIGSLYIFVIGQNFTTYNNETVPSGLFSLSSAGNLNTTFNNNLGTGFAGGEVRGAIYSNYNNDFSVLVYGNFTSLNGVSVSGLVRLNSFGQIVNTLDIGTGANGTGIYNVAIPFGSNADIYIVGDFTSFNGTSVGNIVKIDYQGNIDTTFVTNSGTGFDGIVKNILINQFPTVTLYLSDVSISEYNGTTINLIAKLDSDGTLDTTFNAGTGSTYTASYINGMSYVNGPIIYGSITDINGTARKNIAEYNATDGTLLTIDLPDAYDNTYTIKNVLFDNPALVIQFENTATEPNRIISFNYSTLNEYDFYFTAFDKTLDLTNIDVSVIEQATGFSLFTFIDTDKKIKQYYLADAAILSGENVTMYGSSINLSSPFGIINFTGYANTPTNNSSYTLDFLFKNTDFVQFNQQLNARMTNDTPGTEESQFEFGVIASGTYIDNHVILDGTGFKYTSNLSALWTNRSIVDKEYVDNVIAGTNGLGSITVSNGLTKNVNDIQLGGTLTSDINIDGDGVNPFNFNIGTNSTVQGFYVNAGDIAFSNYGGIGLRDDRSIMDFYSAGVNTARIFMDSTGLALFGGDKDNNTQFTQINLGSSDSANNFIITDNRTTTNQSGIEYAADYSANFTARSLVDKAYVTSAYSFSNGLTSDNGAVKLGGTLTENTTIDGDGKNLSVNFSTLSLNAGESNIIFYSSGPSSLFSVNGGFDDPTSSTQIQKIGRDYFGKYLTYGSYYSTYQGNTINDGLFRINIDGSYDNTFNPPNYWSDTPPNSSTVISDIATASTSGGAYAYVAKYDVSTSTYFIDELNADGSINGNFSTAGSFNGTVVKLILQPDGKLIAAGGFTSYNTVSANGMIRLNPNGSWDNTFDIGTGFNTQPYIYQLSPYDNKFIISGDFSTFDGNTANDIVRLNNDGSLDSSFDSGAGVSGGVLLNPSVILPNGKLIVTANITSYDGTNIGSPNRIFGINADGSYDNSFTSTSNFGSIYGYYILPSGNIILFGEFTNFNGETIEDIVEITQTGEIAKIFTNVEKTGFGSRYNDGVISADGSKLVLVGIWDAINGITTNGITAININASITITNTDGMRYAADYSSQFVDRSLVDKAYVLNLIGNEIQNNKYKTIITGDNSTTDFVVTHNFGSRDVIVQIFANTAPYDTVENAVERTSINSVTIKFTTAPANAVEYRVLITLI